MQNVTRELTDLSTVQHTFNVCGLPSEPEQEVLVIQFDGEAGNSPEHFGAFSLMRAVIAAGVAAWRPASLVLDLRRLTYEWGDNMAEVLTFAYPLPTTVVVSDLNRDGLASLVEQEIFGDPKRWLFESTEQAIGAVDRAVQDRRNFQGPAPYVGDPLDPEPVSSRLALADLVDRLRVDLGSNPDRWGNPTLESFLRALSSYLEDVPGYLKNTESAIDPEEPSWQLFAVVMAGARVYE